MKKIYIPNTHLRHFRALAFPKDSEPEIIKCNDDYDLYKHNYIRLDGEEIIVYRISADSEVPIRDKEISKKYTKINRVKN